MNTTLLKTDLSAAAKVGRCVHRAKAAYAAQQWDECQDLIREAYTVAQDAEMPQRHPLSVFMADLAARIGTDDFVWNDPLSREALEACLCRECRQVLTNYEHSLCGSCAQKAQGLDIDADVRAFAGGWR